MKRTFFCLAFVFGSFAGTFLCTQPVRGEVDAVTADTPKDGEEQTPYVCEYPCDPRYDACYDESYMDFVEASECEAVAEVQSAQPAEQADPWSYEGTCWYGCDSANECEYSWTEKPAEEPMVEEEAVAEVTETPATDEVASEMAADDDYYDYYSKYDEYYWEDDYYGEDDAYEDAVGESIAEESVAEVVEARITDTIEEAESEFEAAGPVTARVTDAVEEAVETEVAEAEVAEAEVAEAEVAPAAETESDASEYGYDPYDYGYDDYDYEDYYDEEFAWDSIETEEAVADETEVAEVEEVAEVVAEEAPEATVEEAVTEVVEQEVVEMLDESYDDEYDYGYDYEYDYYDDYSYEDDAPEMVETEEALDAPPEMPLATEELAPETEANAVLTLANVLDQAGKTLQSWSRRLTEMAAPEVAENTDDSIQR